MYRIQTLIQSLLLVSALTFSGSALAGFNFGGDSCADGSGTFSQEIPHNETAEVGVIPVGMSNVKVDLISSVDVDIQLIDVLTDAPIVHWKTGVVTGGQASCAIFNKVEYCYSGYAGVNGQAGNEYIHINGTTNREVKMLAYGYTAGDAQVDYSWEAPTGCVDAGSGQFDQALELNNVVDVGTIPAGKKNVEVNLESDADVDIEIYHGDKAIVAWKCSGKPSFSTPCLSSGSASTVDYEGMTLSYSGFNGVNGQAGHEFIKIEGTLTQPLTVKAFAYAAGTAKVTYSWGPNADANGTSAPAAGTSTPAAGESTPSNTPDPAGYCGADMGWDSGTDMCIIQPEYTAAKEKCDTDLTSANTAKSSCEANLAQETKDLEYEIALSLGYEVDIAALTTEKAACESNLTSANTAKSSCESELSVSNAAKTDADSSLATCQFDLTDAQSNGTGAAFDLTTHYFAIDGTVATPTPLTVCSAGSQFESSAPTPLLDRVCSGLTECASIQYEATASTPTSDRVCQNQVTCALGQIVTVAGTATSAQVCEDLCASDEYMDVSSDGCIALTVCTEDKVETNAPTAITDRECGPKSDVIAYQFELGALNMATGRHDSKLKGDDGSVVNCETIRLMGEYNLDCRNDGWMGIDAPMTGRVAIYGLAANINNISLGHYNDITDIVHVDRAGSKITSIGFGEVKGLEIDMGNVIPDKTTYGTFGNPSFNKGCPNGLNKHEWSGAVKTGIIVRHDGDLYTCQSW